jgi:hypothetical protein
MSVRSLLAVAANRLLSPGRAVLTPSTNPAEVRRVIASLSPRSTDRALIRLGPAGDGGYLVPDDLRGISACFSPGVSTVSGFERDCAERGMNVFMADASVAGPAEYHPRFHFRRKFVGVTTDPTFMTMDEWVANTIADAPGDLMLQIDIEGYEYEVLLGMSDDLMRRWRIIVAEFHGLEELWNRPWFSLASRALEKLSQTHLCVHAHPNNSRGVLELNGLRIPRDCEFTFLRRDHVAGATMAREFPHPLDHDCAPGPSVVLPDCWIAADA